MLLLDTNILIDVLRNKKVAIDWLLNSSEPISLPAFVILELIDGCRNKVEVTQLRSFLQHFPVVFPTDKDYQRAIDTYFEFRVSNHIGILDVLIGETAVGLDATLCTANLKHFKVIPNLNLKKPY